MICKAWIEFFNTFKITEENFDGNYFFQMFSLMTT